jgi:outer membrane protein assembly factor BamD
MSWPTSTTRLPPHYILALFAIYISLLSGCSSGAKEINPDPELKEIVTKKDGQEDTPEHIILGSAKKSYQNHLFSVAKEQFTSLQSNFPTGPYADFAEIKIADCSFYSGDYDLAAPLYEDYAKNHPGTMTAAYALLMAARSYHLSSKGVGHDAHALEKARELYLRLLELYPDSVYNKQAASYLRSTIEDLTTNEIEVAEFYKKMGMDEAYAARVKVVEDKWLPMTKSIDKTYGLKAETVVLDKDEQAQEATAEEETGEEETEQIETTDAQVDDPVAITDPIEVPTEEVTPSADETTNSNATEDALEEEEDENEDEEKEELVVAASKVEPLEDIEASITEEPELDDSETLSSSLSLTRKIPTIIPTIGTVLPSVPPSVANAQPTRIVLRPAAAIAPTTNTLPPVNSPLPTIAATTQPLKLKPALAKDTVTKVSAASAGIVKIVRVECSNQNVFLFLDQTYPDRSLLKKFAEINPLDGVVSLTLPGVNAEENTYDCFNQQDLFITSTGTITIEGDQPMFVRALDNPPKIAIITKRFSAD